jgi:hypothetical protein
VPDRWLGWRRGRLRGTPLLRKLGVKEGQRLAFPGAPASFQQLLGQLPGNATVNSRLRGHLDLIVFFTRRRAELERRLPALRRALDPAGGLWIAWPKRSSGVESDLSEDGVRGLGLATAWSTTKVCAIDETWSGLRLVVRLRDRPS